MSSSFSSDLHQFHQKNDDQTEETTATSTQQSVPSSPSLSNHVDESNDGFRTPTNRTIPLTTVCPPAPKKPKSRKRFLTSLLRDEEVQEVQEGDLQLVIDVSVWLDFLEDEDRKRNRIKRARRQEDQAGNDTTTTATTL